MSLSKFIYEVPLGGFAGNLKAFGGFEVLPKKMPAFLEIALEIRSLFMVPTGSEAKDLMGLAL